VTSLQRQAIKLAFLAVFNILFSRYGYDEVHEFVEMLLDLVALKLREPEPEIEPPARTRDDDIPF